MKEIGIQTSSETGKKRKQKQLTQQWGFQRVKISTRGHGVLRE